MKKITKVELVRHSMNTADTPRIYTSIQWEIPYDSTAETQKTSKLEANMMETLNTELPEAYRPAAASMIYGDLSSGGTLHVDELKLTVEFRKA